jgi:hypothetical protein
VVEVRSSAAPFGEVAQEQKDRKAEEQGTSEGRRWCFHVGQLVPSPVLGGGARQAPLAQIVQKPRGDLEKVLPREDLKPRDVPTANPRAQPEGLPSEYPKAFRFSRGGTFFRYHPRLFHNLSDFGFLEVQGSLPRDHYGKILVNLQ